MEVIFTSLFFTVIEEIAKTEKGKRIIENVKEQSKSVIEDNTSRGWSIVKNVSKQLAQATQARIKEGMTKVDVEGMSLPKSFFTFFEDSFEIKFQNSEIKKINQLILALWSSDNKCIKEFLSKIIALHLEVCMTPSSDKEKVRKDSIPSLREFVKHHDNEALDEILVEIWEVVMHNKEAKDIFGKFADSWSVSIGATRSFIEDKGLMKK